MRKLKVRPENIYNMDEKGFVQETGSEGSRSLWEGVGGIPGWRPLRNVPLQTP